MQGGFLCLKIKIGAFWVIMSVVHSRQSPKYILSTIKLIMLPFTYSNDIILYNYHISEGGEHMKNREIVLWTIAGFILVFVVPIIINECYKANSGYLTMWTAADMLSYYGTILAASGAVIGVFLSIQYSQKQYKEDTRHRALPY